MEKLGWLIYKDYGTLRQDITAEIMRCDGYAGPTIMCVLFALWNKSCLRYPQHV